MESKQCGCCKTTKSIDCFRVMIEKRPSRYKCGHLEYRCSRCKECERQKALERYNKKREECQTKAKEYKQKNYEVLKEKRKQYLEKNKEYIKERYKRYCQNNKAKILQIAREYRAKNSLNVRLRKNFKSRIVENIHKQHSTCDYLGSPIGLVKQWLEFNFNEDINWNNYGEVWHIDHTLPINRFDLSKDLDVFVCFNWKNLMPLYKDTNIKKHDHIWHYRIFLQETKLKEFAKTADVNATEVEDFLTLYCTYFKTMMETQ